MKIVIIGLGTIGHTILKSIDRVSHTITVIDQDKEKIENVIERYDVFGVVGNGACREILQEAEVDSADLVIVLTKSDELNILACLVAKNIGAKNTIARVRNPEYRSQIMDMQDSLGISMIVNPEKDTAREIFNLINLPSIAQIDYFAKGRALLVEIVVDKGNEIVGETLITLGKRLKTKVLICAVQRGKEVIIPSGNFMIESGDRIYFTADANSLGAFLSEINLVKSPLRRVMIVGGDMVSFYLADELSSKGYKVKLLENEKDRAEELATILPKATIIEGNGTQHDLLLEEGIEAMDAFVALTHIDEENMIVSMFANKMNVRKTITMIKNDSLYAMLGELGIQNNVSPTTIVANRILSYIRALDNSRGSNVLNLYRLVNNQVEALEFDGDANVIAYTKKDGGTAVTLREGEILKIEKRAIAPKESKEEIAERFAAFKLPSHPGRQFLAVANAYAEMENGVTIVGTKDGCVALINNGKVFSLGIVCNDGAVHDIAVSPDGKRAVGVAGDPYSLGIVFTYDAENGLNVEGFTYYMNGCGKDRLASVSCEPCCVAFSRDGKRLAIGVRDKLGCVYEYEID